MSNHCLFIATNNKKKILEIKNVVEKQFAHLETPQNHNENEPIEDAGTFVGNALIKARFWYNKTKLPTLADDSGLCMHALGGFPGVETATFAKKFDSYAETFNALWDRLNGKNDDSTESNMEITRGTFVCVLAYIDASGAEHIFEGRMSGHLINTPRGHEGFAFDPVFVPENRQHTVAELGAKWKHTHSHRAKALKQFSKFLTQAE